MLDKESAIISPGAVDTDCRRGSNWVEEYFGAVAKAKGGK
jgi:hypothetical protein